MAEISSIILPNGSTYALKDAGLRSQAGVLSGNGVEVSGVNENYFRPTVKVFDAQPVRTDLSVIKLSADDYDQLVVDGNVLSNALYIVEDDHEDLYGEQIRNLAPGTALSDAVNYEQLSEVSARAYDTYTKTETDQKIANAQYFKKYVVQTLPPVADADERGIYLVPSSDPETQNTYDEYVVVGEGAQKAWEKIGTKNIDLSGYKTKQTAKTSPAASSTTTSFIDTISQNENGEITATKKTVQSASTSQAGIVQLNNSTSSTSTSQAATANAVKTAYDLANGRVPNTIKVAGQALTADVTAATISSAINLSSYVPKTSTSTTQITAPNISLKIAYDIIVTNKNTNVDTHQIGFDNNHSYIAIIDPNETDWAEYKTNGIQFGGTITDYSLAFPEKSGTLALAGDSYLTSETSSASQIADSLATKSTVSVDTVKSDVNIQHISREDYAQLIVNNAVLSNTLYILSGSYIDAYGKQVKNLSAGTELSDAVNLGQLQGYVPNTREVAGHALSADVTTAHLSAALELGNMVSKGGGTITGSLQVGNNATENIILDPISASITTQYIKNSYSNGLCHIPDGPGTLALTSDIPAIDSALSVQGAAADAKAVGDALRYSLAQPDPFVLGTLMAVVVQDRAVNRIQVQTGIETLMVTIPAGPTGKSRDFFLRIEVPTGVTNLHLTIGAGAVTPVIETADGDLPTIEENSTTIMYFAETKTNTFLVKSEAVTVVS